MKNVRYLVLFFLALATASCSQRATYEVPMIADQFISFTIDGQPITLRSVDVQAYEPNNLFFRNDNNSLSLSRNSADLTTRFTIYAENVPLTQKRDGPSVDRQAYVPATITVISAEMMGTVYCPHTVEGTGEAISYRGLIRVESIDDDGRIRGSFKTDPAATDNVVTITDGTFDLLTNIY